MWRSRRVCSISTTKFSWSEISSSTFKQNDGCWVGRAFLLFFLSFFALSFFILFLRLSPFFRVCFFGLSPPWLGWVFFRIEFCWCVCVLQVCFPGSDCGRALCSAWPLHRLSHH